MSNPNTSPSCGQALVRLLERYGVDTVFGIPGVHTLDLYRGLDGSPIRHVLTRHEQGAGFMADGYARSTGKPGVCFTITGPGVTNVATPVGQAYADSVPLLVISSVNHLGNLGKGRGELHECKRQRGIMEPITGFSATALCPADVPDLLARAFGLFASERPRPVFIEIPLDVLAAPVPEDWADTPAIPAPRPAPRPDSVVAAARLLAAAQRPVIIVGGGAVDASAELQTLAEAAGAAVFTSVAGKGLLPAGHPLNGGASLCVTPGWDYLAGADAILAVGTEMAETDFWRPRLDFDGPLIRVDLDPAKMNDLYRAAVPIVADAAATLAAIRDALPVTTADAGASVRALDRMKTAIAAEQAPLQRAHLCLLDAIRPALPADVRIAADMTQLAYSGNYLFDVDQPRRWLHPTGYGTLGYALPAAIGAAIASAAPTLAMVGDGGILYTVQELATAVEELRSPLVVLLWNNESLGQIRDDMEAQGIAPIGVSPRNPDFVALAESFGCRARRPASLAALAADLADAFARPGVTLIEANDSLVLSGQGASA